MKLATSKLKSSKNKAITIVNKNDRRHARVDASSPTEKISNKTKTDARAPTSRLRGYSEKYLRHIQLPPRIKPDTEKSQQAKMTTETSLNKLFRSLENVREIRSALNQRSHQTRHQRTIRYIKLDQLNAVQVNILQQIALTQESDRNQARQAHFLPPDPITPAPDTSSIQQKLNLLNKLPQWCYEHNKAYCDALHQKLTEQLSSPPLPPPSSVESPAINHTPTTTTTPDPQFFEPKTSINLTDEIDLIDDLIYNLQTDFTTLITDIEYAFHHPDQVHIPPLPPESNIVKNAKISESTAQLAHPPPSFDPSNIDRGPCEYATISLVPTPPPLDPSNIDRGPCEYATINLVPPLPTLDPSNIDRGPFAAATDVCPHIVPPPDPLDPSNIDRGPIQSISHPKPKLNVPNPPVPTILLPHFLIERDKPLGPTLVPIVLH